MLPRLLFALVFAVILACLGAFTQAVRAQGFTESDITFYGEVRKSGGGQTVLLQGGHLKLTFVNQTNPADPFHERPEIGVGLRAALRAV